MSKIALSGDAAGTGTFTIASPNSNSNFTLTLPAESGTVLTTGSTTGISASALSTGTIPKARMYAGAVLQVVQAVRTSFISTTSATPIDALSANITPASASSSFLVMCSGLECTYAGDGNTYSIHQLVRNGSNIYIGDAAGSASRGSSGRFGRQADASPDTVAFNYLDSPNTTSVLTYKWQFASVRGPSWTVSLGGSARSSFVGDVRSPISMIIMEIAG